MKTICKKQRNLIIVAVMVAFLVILAGTACAADEKPVVTVGGEKVGEQEMVNLLVLQSGVSRGMARLVLAQTTLEQRQQLANQVVMSLILSQAAMMKGLHLDEDVALTLRWNRANTLAQAYVNKVAANWSLHREDLEKYYEAHKEDYVVPESAHVRHILTSTKEEASRVLLEVMVDPSAFPEVARAKSIDRGSAQNGGDLGWVTPGQTVPAFDKLVFSMKENSIKGPVESRFGWHVVQVLEREPAHQQSFEEALPQLQQDIQQWYLEQEVEKLKERFNVTIDEKTLSNLGGIPAIK